MQSSLKKPTSINLPNGILIFALIYFAFIISEEISLLRRVFYTLLFLVDLIALILINSNLNKARDDFVLMIQNIYDKIMKKEKQQEPDEIKNLIDKSVKETFGTMDKYTRDPKTYPRDRIYEQPSNIQYFQEKELINSKSKIDERFVSGKLISPMKNQQSQDYIGERYSQIKFNPYLINSESDIFSQSYSHRLLKSLQHSQKFSSKLKIGIEINKDQVEEDADKLGLYNYDQWMNNLRHFLSNNLIAYLIDDHYENIDHLNRLLDVVNIQLVSTPVDDKDYDNFKDKLAYLIINTNLNFSSVKNINISYKDNFNVRSSVPYAGFHLLPENNIGEKQHVKIFFGDNDKLKFIRDRVDEKLRLIQIHKEKSKMHLKEMEEYTQKNIAHTLFSSRRDKLMDSGISQIVRTDKQKPSIHNPLINKSRMDRMSDFAVMLESQSSNTEENLKILRQFIKYRIELNDLIYPYFIKEQNMKHRHLILEYVVWRLKDLQIANFDNFKNDCGGNFKDDQWFSAFPTDSQFVSSIFIKYFEDIFRENDITKPFLVNYPLPPSAEKNSNSLFFYQMNPPGCEPHFMVYFEDQSFNSIPGKENFFYAGVIFLFLMKTKMTNITKKLAIDDTISSIIK